MFWNAMEKWQQDPFDKILWYHEIWSTIIYCGALYFIVLYIVPYYKQLIASISLILYSLISIVAVSYLKGAKVEAANYTGSFTFQVILDIVILGISVYLISKCNGQYKDSE